jgi:hypothetical protein
MRRLVGRISLLLLIALLCSGCSTLKPWERDILARPDMAWEDDPNLSGLRKHTFFSKEASLPGGGGSGGGCGCN